ETVLVTVHPHHIAPVMLSYVDTVIAVGPSPEKTLKNFADAVDQPFVWPEGLAYQKDRAVVWFRRQATEPFSIEIVRGRSERIRHHPKYAEGDMRHRSLFLQGHVNR